jgi:hypothetical protein
METDLRPRWVLAVFGLAVCGASSLAGCAVSGSELRSMPTLGPEAAVVHACAKKSGMLYRPAGGAELCFTIHGVEVEAEAMNAEPTAAAIGFLFPLIPYGPEKTEPSQPLEIELWLMTKERYAFDPWRALVRTAQGETIGVSRVRINVSDERGVHTVELDPRAPGAHALPTRFFLTFEKHVAPEQEFVLTFQLIGPDRAEVPVPTIRFEKGEISYLDSVP